jgi:hypothetical protein
MAIKITNGLDICTHMYIPEFAIPNSSKNIPNLTFWYESIPSGNPV